MAEMHLQSTVLENNLKKSKKKHQYADREDELQPQAEPDFYPWTMRKERTIQRER